MLAEPVVVIARLARVFDTLGVCYVVGGSVASSVYGIPRATQDVDLVADIELAQVEAMASALSPEFYVDADMIRDAVQRRTSFNVIHLATMLKADVFIRQQDSWSREEMARARTEQSDLPEGQVSVRSASPVVFYPLATRRPIRTAARTPRGAAQVIRSRPFDRCCSAAMIQELAPAGSSGADAGGGRMRATGSSDCALCAMALRLTTSHVSIRLVSD